MSPGASPADTPFADVAATSVAVAGTTSRRAKADAVAALLRRLGPGEIEPTVAWLAGEARQGRVGAGWRTLSALDVAPTALAGLTVGRVDAAFADLAATAGSGSAGRRSAALRDLLAAATGPEQAFLRSLLTGELRQGALEGVMVEAIAAAAAVPTDAVRRALMLSGQLPAAASAALAGGTAELARITLRVGTAVRPMLAAPAASLAEAVAELGPELTIESKLDGARIQVHRDGADVAVFTRSLKDITAAVPALVALAVGLPGRSVVLDGETLAVTDEGRPRPFQESMSRSGAAAHRPYFFDCLHLDGADLLDEPLHRRLAALADVASDLRVPGLPRPSPAEADAWLARSLAAGHEGVMVKSLLAPYAAGRRGRAWQKVKPVHTLDLVVLAAEWGYGRRTGLLSNIHLGARDPNGGPPVMVGKTFKGMTDDLLRWQTQEFGARARSDDGHVVTLAPEFVVEIAVDGAQVSRRYPGGVALRFARVLRYRPDKDPAEADTLDAVRALLAP